MFRSIYDDNLIVEMHKCTQEVLAIRDKGLQFLKIVQLIVLS